jgi:hypothetical protein
MALEVVMPHGDGKGATTTTAIAYPLAWRIIAALLTAISGAALPVLLVITVSGIHYFPPLMLMRVFSILVIAPASAAWLIKRAFAARVEVTGGTLVIERRELRVEIPCRAIARITAWTIPLPGSGLWLRLQSGRRFRYGLQLDDPTALLEALAEAGGLDAARVLLQHPSVVYARAKHGGPRWRWYHLLLKYPAFALVPTLPLFRVDQIIVWGGTFGQYYLRGLKPYLQGFGLLWTVMIIDLVIYAGGWRILAEAGVLLAAWAAPSRAARVRRLAEVACRVLYYGGIPALLIWRFLP